MRRVVSVGLAAIAGLVLITGVFLAGMGSGLALAEVRRHTALLPGQRSLSPTSAPTPSESAATPTPVAPAGAAAATPSISVVAPTAPVLSPPWRPFDPPDSPVPAELQVLHEVWDIVQSEFFGDLPDARELEYAAIDGLLSRLGDANTTFIEPSSAAIINEDATGEMEGIGAYVGLDDGGRLAIIRPFEDGPAAVAGLLPGDLVLEVDRTPLEGLSLYEAIGMIRGPAGTDVRLLIVRSTLPDPFEILVTRARIEVPTTTMRMTEEDVGYIRLHSFNASARDALESDLRELLEREPVGIVLDLRQNPGGWLDQAIEVADLFLRSGVILTELWADGTEEVYEARLGDVGERVPLVVLVDAGSASASEIVAGALQDHERAILVGEATYGKGSVQRPHTLSDGSELRVTIAAWYTPDGSVIHGEGLTPDIEVGTPEGAATEDAEDVQLLRAIRHLIEGE